MCLGVGAAIGFVLLTTLLVIAIYKKRRRVISKRDLDNKVSYIYIYDFLL